MSSIGTLIERLKKVRQGLQDGNLIGEVIKPKKGDILELVQGQLWDGKAASGEDIRPYYTEDPYFSTPELANIYVAWKQDITPNSNRNPNAPNLYINGKFYSEIDVAFTQDGFGVVPTGTLSRDVFRKYGEKVFGLTDENLNYLMRDRGVLDKLMQTIKYIIYG